MTESETAETKEGRRKPPRSGALTEFLLWTFVAGPLVTSVLVVIGLRPLARLMLTVLPAVVALLVARRRGIPLSDWGLTVFDRRALIGMGLPVGITALATVIALALGVRSDEGWARTAADLGEAAAMLPVLFSAGLGQELGWRGLLQTELGRRGLPTAVVFASLAGAVWLAPRSVVSFAADDGAVALLIVANLVGAQIIMGWLRIRAGSVHASALFYAMWIVLTVRHHANQSLAAMAVGTLATVLVAAALMWRWPPAQDRWPSQYARSRADSE